MHVEYGLLDHAAEHRFEFFGESANKLPESEVGSHAASLTRFGHNTELVIIVILDISLNFIL